MAGGGGNKQKRVKEGRVEGREAESGKRGGAGWGGDRDTRREGCVSARACFRKIKGGGDGGEGVSGLVSLGDWALVERARHAHFM